MSLFECCSAVRVGLSAAAVMPVQHALQLSTEQPGKMAREAEAVTCDTAATTRVRYVRAFVFAVLEHMHD